MNDEKHTPLNVDDVQRISAFSKEVVGAVTRYMSVMIDKISDSEYTGLPVGTFETSVVLELSDGGLQECPFVIEILSPDKLIKSF